MTPSRLIAIWLSMSPKSCSTNGFQTMTPALFTRTSTAPKRSTTVSQHVAGCPRRELQRHGEGIRRAEAEASLRDLLGLGACSK